MSDTFDIIVQSRLDQSSSAVEQLKKDMKLIESQMKDERFDLTASILNSISTKNLREEIKVISDTLMQTGTTLDLSAKLKDGALELIQTSMNELTGKNLEISAKITDGDISTIQKQFDNLHTNVTEKNFGVILTAGQNSLEQIRKDIGQLEIELAKDTQLNISVGVNPESFKELETQLKSVRDEVAKLGEGESTTPVKVLNDNLKTSKLSAEEMEEAIKRMNSAVSASSEKTIINAVTNEDIKNIRTYSDSLEGAIKLITSYDSQGKISSQNFEIQENSLKAQKSLYADLKSLNGEIFTIEKQMIKATDEQAKKLEKQRDARVEMSSEIKKKIATHNLTNTELEEQLKLTQDLRKAQMDIAREKDIGAQSNKTYAELTRLANEEFKIRKQMEGLDESQLGSRREYLKIVNDTQAILQASVSREEGTLFNEEKHNELLVRRQKLNLDLQAQQDKMSQREAIRVEKLNEKVGDVDFGKDDFYDDQAMRNYILSLQEAGAEVTKFERRIDSAGNRQIQMTVATETSKDKIKEFKYAVDESSAGLYKMSEAIKPNTSRMVGFVGQMQQAISKSITWAISMGLLYGSLQKLKDGVQTIKDLDKELTQIAMTTGITREETHQLAVGYAELGKQMGKTAMEISKVNTELVRQGLSLEESQRRMQTILKLSASGGMDTSQSLQIVTSSVNALGEDAEKTADILLRAGQISASSAEGIGEALTKTASSAKATGMSIEELTATVATLVEVTQESPSSLGNSLKTLLARFNKIDEATGEVNQEFNKVQEAFESVGVAFTDGAGQIRPMFDLLKDLSPIWNDLDKNTKMYLATQSAGKTNLMPAHTVMCA